MERELWSELSRAVREADAGWADSPRYTHRTADVVRVHLWSALHDRPTSWACDPRNWPPGPRAWRVLPDQSTVSRRKRKADFEAFMNAVGERLAGHASALSLVKRLDGKPMPVAAHSTDRDAAWGRGAGQNANGYKLHTLWAQRRPMPEQWAVAPLDVCERRLARRFATRLTGAGYVLADAYYDASDVYDRFRAAGHQLVAPRRRSSRGKGLGHCYQSPHRLRSLALTEPPAPDPNGFGATLLAGRDQVERDFGNLSGFGGGLAPLPAWARRIWRVRAWVHAKLLINAARIHCRRRVVGA